MKHISFAALFLLIASCIALGQEKNSKLEAQLVQMDKEWTAAELRGDTKAAAAFIADDFWQTTAEGTMENKAQYVASLKASKDTDVGDDYSVRVYGNTAIMTHRGTVKGERSFQYRSTHVWMNRGGKWQIVAHHSGEIPAKAESAEKQKAAEQASEKSESTAMPASSLRPAASEKPKK